MQGVIAIIMFGQLFTSSGVFGTAESYGVAAVDLNRDGFSDVVVASDQGVGYYRNQANSSFAARKELYPTGAVPARAVVAGDLNGDGHIDLFVATMSQDFLLINTGDDSTFTRTDTPFTSEASYAASLVDCDLDGDLDIFVAGAASRLYANDGKANLTISATFDAGFGVSFSDYNSDSRPDFALASGPRIIFYRGLSAGGFLQDTIIQLTAPRGLCWFDWKQNGTLDLAVADSAGVNVVIEPTLDYAVTAIGSLVEPSVAVAAGDFDAQEGVDLLFINYGIEDRIYRGPNLVFQPDDTVSYGTKETRSVALADLDGENGLDAVVVGSGGNALYTSRTSRDNRIFVKLEGRGDEVMSLSPTIACGAKVRFFESGTLKGFWEVAAGSGHAGQDAPLKSFPMSATENRLLVVTWPRSGVVDSLALDTFSLPSVIDFSEDITPPMPPESLVLHPPHDTIKWWNNPNVTFSWKSGSDPHGSGLSGYSYLWSNDTAAVPEVPAQIPAADTMGVFKADCEGKDCYFFLSSVDSVENVSAPARFGPLKLDFSKPVGIVPQRPSSGAYLNDTFVSYRWSRGSDAYSKIASYRLEVSNYSSFITLLDSATLEPPPYPDTVPYQSLKKLGESQEPWYYWRVMTQDSAGNVDTMPPDSFKIDTTSPEVIYTYPAKGDSARINTSIIIRFSEPLFVSEPTDINSATNPIHYQISQPAISKNYSFTVTMGDAIDTNTVCTLRISENLAPLNATQVLVRSSIRDRALNQMGSDYLWSFTTKLAPDTVGPHVESVELDPNPTGGAKKVAIIAYASDSAYGGSPLSRCSYWIDDDTTTRPMKIQPILFKATFLDTLDLDTVKLSSGDHQFRFQAVDIFENPGPFYDDTLTVNPTPPPTITISILNDTSRQKLRIGDTLRLMIKTSDPLSDLTVRLFNQDSLYKELFYQPGPDDSVFINTLLEGLPPGRTTLTAFGTNPDDVLGTASISFTVEPLELLAPERAFAVPNPAHDELSIYFTPGEDVRASLWVFTIDGLEVWRAGPVDVTGGNQSSFDTDVASWPTGLYLFVLEVKHSDGRRAVVRKPFAVVR